MTVTYSLSVANTKFCGFTKLLGRWKGSIYKILWKEFLCFCCAYFLLSLTYRLFLTEPRRRSFEKVVIYCETFVELIPLSFVLGFYVSLVIGRWWNQFDAIPWPDRTCYLIAAVIHGADERSRIIRRTLGRMLILLQLLTFQAVSPAVKKRFPTVWHMEEAGLMTKEERTIYESIEIPYGKWWLPAHWFCAILSRAKKEGRIKDSILQKLLMKELLNYRSACGTMFNYDWISVPLVYTQVVTLATYTYSFALIMGRQYLDPKQGYENHRVDLYIPVFTLLQFFFYIGWLKVAEQIVNPYGEDDDDFELNWCLDRNSQIVFMLVDHLHSKHPKLKRDQFWDQLEPQIPHTKFSAKNFINPQLGSAANLEINPTETDFLPMETLLEEDEEINDYSSIKRPSGMRYRPSILMSLFTNNLGLSLRRKSTRKDSLRNVSTLDGHSNPSFAIDGFAPRKGSTPTVSRKSSKKSSPVLSRSSSRSFRQSSVSRPKFKSNDGQQAETSNISNSSTTEVELDTIPTTNGKIKTFGHSISETRDIDESNYEEPTSPVKDDTQKSADAAILPSIPEEPSRTPLLPLLGTDIDSSASSSRRNMNELVAEANKVLHDLNEANINSSASSSRNNMNELVAEANKVLHDLNEAVEQHEDKDNRTAGYESCCSVDHDDSSEEMEGTAQSQEISITVENNRPDGRKNSANFSEKL